MRDYNKGLSSLVLHTGTCADLGIDSTALEERPLMTIIQRGTQSWTDVRLSFMTEMRYRYVFYVTGTRSVTTRNGEFTSMASIGTQYGLP